MKKVLAALSVSVLFAVSVTAHAGGVPKDFNTDRADGYIQRNHAVASGVVPKTTVSDVYFFVDTPFVATLWYEVKGEAEIRKETAKVDDLEKVCDNKPKACFMKLPENSHE